MIYEIVILWFLNLFDYIMSKYYIGKYGLIFEMNPIMRFLFANPPLDFVVKIGVVTICCEVLYFLREYKVAKFGAWVLIVLYTCVAITHII